MTRKATMQGTEAAFNHSLNPISTPMVPAMRATTGFDAIAVSHRADEMVSPDMLHIVR